jgi:hypothetical protein
LFVSLPIKEEEEEEDDEDDDDEVDDEEDETDESSSEPQSLSTLGLTGPFFPCSFPCNPGAPELPFLAAETTSVLSTAPSSFGTSEEDVESELEESSSGTFLSTTALLAERVASFARAELTSPGPMASFCSRSLVVPSDSACSTRSVGDV